MQAQNLFEEGKQWYEQRATEADSFRAHPKYVNNAIRAFEKSLNENIEPQKSGAFLLKSYYFKGMYLGLDEKQKKEIYEKGRRLGEQMVERFPRSVPIKFWYGANMGRWADVHGFIASATSGLAKKLRSLCHDIIKIDSTYQGGGGYRILAQVHFYAPSIPVFMGWPSDEQALELIEKAMNIAPDHPTNRLLYAEILLEFDRKSEARKQLQYITGMKPRQDYLVEDRYVKHRAEMLVNKNYGIKQTQ